MHRLLNTLLILALAAGAWLIAATLAKAEDAGKEPAAALLSAPQPKPVAPPTAAEIETSIRRGVEFLLATQNKNGSFGSAFPARTRDVFAPVPGSHHAFRAAVTSMCISALIEAGGEDTEALKALDRAERWLFEHLPDVRRATPTAIYNNWAHAYSIHALARMLGRSPNDKQRCGKIRGLMEQQIDMLGRYECVDGGWAYYDFDYHTQKPGGSSISFVTATVLLALDEAKQVGIEVPEKLTGRAVATIVGGQVKHAR